MNIIYVISPTYLNAVLEEAMKYDFRIQGYGSIKNANKGLLKTQIVDILGFSYINTKLPDNLEPLRRFMQRCSILIEDLPVHKKFIFALQDTEGFEEIFDRDYGNLDISFIPDIEVFTDVEFNRMIFGSILKYNFNPYDTRFGNKSDDVSSVMNTFSLSKSDMLKLHSSFPKLEYRQAVNPYYLKVFSDCKILDTIGRTLEYDNTYQDYKTFNPLLALLREIFLNIEFVKKAFDGYVLLTKTKSDFYKKRLDMLKVKLDNFKDQLKCDDSEDALSVKSVEIYVLIKGIIFLLDEELLQTHDFIYNNGGVHFVRYS